MQPFGYFSTIDRTRQYRDYVGKQLSTNKGIFVVPYGVRTDDFQLRVQRFTYEV